MIGIALLSLVAHSVRGVANDPPMPGIVKAISHPVALESPRVPEAATLRAGATAAASARRILTKTVVGSSPMTGPQAWQTISRATAWAALAGAAPATRPAARWSYARSLIGQGYGQEARGVLQTMLASNADLREVENFQLASGAASAEAGDAKGALAALGDGSAGSGQLAANPEACAWRLWAQSTLGRSELALGQVGCALPALNARSPAARARFLYAAADAALLARRPALVVPLLNVLPDTDPEANVYRGRAASALGDSARARALLRPVAGGSRKQQVDARISLLEADLANGDATPVQIADLDQLALTWRGDRIEQRVLQLSYRIANHRHDRRRALVAGAALVRYLHLGDGAAPLLAELQTLLSNSLAPNSPLPLAEAAGLFWDYRDLAPAGSRGDFLASQLADRLQTQGLFLRAAELLRYQLLERTKDVAQGPLSARVASLYILAGQPTPALAAIRATDTTSYPAAMQWDRHRVEAVALYKLDRQNEALAALQDVPDGGILRSELYWKMRDWPRLIVEISSRLPSNAPPSAGEQATLLRYAIALAMLGRESTLATLRGRYAAALKGTPAAATFDLLTADAATLNADILTAAMLTIPSASPGGAVGELLDVAVTETRPATKR